MLLVIVKPGYHAVGYYRDAGIVLHRHRQVEHRVLKSGFKMRTDARIAQVHAWGREQINIPEDTTHAPHVLVFQVTPIGPLENLHHQGIFSRADSAGKVELRGQVAALAVTHLLSVYPHIKRGINPIEINENAPP